jgi:phosphopantothenate-cysteine ligase
LKSWHNHQDYLHSIPFTTLAEYLHIFRELACSVINPLGSNAMLYLAAAVSDFYIPSANMVSHASPPVNRKLMKSFNSGKA